MSNNAVKIPARSFVSTRNACKLCAPLGASLVFRGIDGCVPLVHGSQGCATYIRRYVISHFREPLDIASSNFSESSAIFGGESNLSSALDNVIRQYNPAMIGIATTCLSETIGDDISRYLSEYRASHENLPVIVNASTPSYSGTHMEGFRSALYAVVDKLADNVNKSGRINIVSTLISAEDLRYIKEILEDMNVEYTLLPDYSETLDGESWEEYQKIPKGGTPISSIEMMGGAAGTIELGAVKPARSVSALLSKKFNVAGSSIGMPIGIDLSDQFFQAIQHYSGKKIPDRISREKGRLIDSYIDAHKYLFGARAIIYGEADLVGSLASFFSEIGVNVVMCATGASKDDLPASIGADLASKGSLLSDDLDFATMLDHAKNLSPDFVIGSSKGFYLSKNLNIPLISCGFPVHDRFGGQRIMHIGYRGTQSLLDRIVNTLLESRQNNSPIGYSYM